MAGLEVVVRPVVFPNIRPRAPQSLPPQDDPEKGFAVIQGNPAGSAGTSHSWSANSSYSRPTEIERRVDETRVYQKDDDGEVNKDNFVDIDVANKITMDEGTAGGRNDSGAGGENDNGAGSGPPAERATGRDVRPYFYQRVKEEDNIEIKNKDVVKKNPNYSGSPP